jgi:hypothetical protein
MTQFICKQAYANCIAQYENDQAGQKNCNTTINDYCGTLDPTKVTASSSSSSSSSSATGTAASASGSASASATATSTTAKAGAATNMALIGNGAAVVAAGIFAALL